MEQTETRRENHEMCIRDSAGGGHNGDFHAGLHTGFQVDVIVQRQIRPEVHKLDVLVSAADTVDSSKTLDNAYRVPVNVIVDQIIACLLYTSRCV